jgi:hypothetical protein
MAHICNPSYSGGRDLEDRGSKPTQGNSLQDPILKNPSQNRAGGVVQGVDPEHKPQYHTHKKGLKVVQGNFDFLIYNIPSLHKITMCQNQPRADGLEVPECKCGFFGDFS